MTGDADEFHAAFPGRKLWQFRYTVWDGISSSCSPHVGFSSSSLNSQAFSYKDALEASATNPISTCPKIIRILREGAFGAGWIFVAPFLGLGLGPDRLQGRKSILQLKNLPKNPKVPHSMFRTSLRG